MFIDCFKNCGKDYLRILNNRYTKVDGKVKIKKETIKNLGPLSKFDDGKPDFLKRFREDFKNGKLEIDGIEDFKIQYQNKEKIKIEFSKSDFVLNPKNIGCSFIDTLLNKLGIYEVLNRTKNDSKIEYDLKGLTQLLVLGRILEPASKKATFENKDKYFFDVTSSTDIKDIYKTLDVLNKKANSIQKRMNTKISQTIGRDTSTTYYDVTNYFFETNYGDEDIIDNDGNIVKEGFRKRGVCKSKTLNPIVQMGLFIDKNGIPVSYHLFPGNKLDQTTLRPALKKTVDDYNLGRVIVVADGGLNSDKNKAHILSVGNRLYSF